jgi:hypothetical protein
MRLLQTITVAVLILIIRPTASFGDSNCVKTINEWCNRHTMNSPSDCFTLAVKDCSCMGKQYGACVVATADYCRNETEMSDSECLAKAAVGCRSGIPSTSPF